MPRPAWSATVRQLVERITASAFVRGAAWIVAGNGAAHALVIASAPVLSRLYTPSDFGNYGAFVAVLMILVAVAGLRFEIAIPVPEDDGVAAQLAVLALAAVTVTAAIAGIAVAVVGWAPDGMTPRSTGGLLALGIIGLGAYQVLSAWSVRGRSYRVVSLSRLTRSGTQVALQVTMGLLHAGAPGLVLGHAVGGAVGVLRMARSLQATVRTMATSIAALRATACMYWRFPAFSVPSGLLNGVGSHAPLLIVLGAYGSELAGGYAFAQRVVAAPVAVVGLAIAQVFIGEFGVLVRERSPAALPMYTRTLWRLFALAVTPVAALAIVAPTAFGWLFGSSWVEAGHLVRALAPLLLTQFAVVPVSSVLNLLQRTRVQLLYDAARLTLGVGSMLVVVSTGAGHERAVLAYALGMAVAYALNAVVGYRVLRGALAADTGADRRCN